MFKFNSNKKNPRLQRQLEPECLGMSFEEYLIYRCSEDFLMPANPTTDTELLQLKLDYLWVSKENLELSKQEIISLWDVMLDIYQDKELSDMDYHLLYLADITTIANIDSRKKILLDDMVLDFALKKLNQELKELNFDEGLSKVCKWFEFRYRYYYQDLQIQSTERELHFLKELSSREQNMEMVKSTHPSLYLKFSRCIYYFFKNRPSRLDYNYDDAIERVLLNSVTLLRNLGYLDYMSEAIYEYHKHKKYMNRRSKYKSCKSWLADFFVGYGEKPHRLLKAFILLHLLFAVLLFPYSNSWWFQLVNVEANKDALIWQQIVQKLISVIYFNNTTMLTIGYGDIYPGNPLTKVTVMVEQLLGFAVTGSFVALQLRKWFRF